jgi:hypothetical protein
LVQTRAVPATIPNSPLWVAKADALPEDAAFQIRNWFGRRVEDVAETRQPRYLGERSADGLGEQEDRELKRSRAARELD